MTQTSSLRSSLAALIRRVPRLHRVVQTAKWAGRAVGLKLADRIVTRNDYGVIVVFGMRRSGNHLSINWMLEQTRGSAAFYNDIVPNQPPRSAHSFESRLRLRNPAPQLVLSYEDVTLDDLLSPPLVEFLEQCHLQDKAPVRFALVVRDPRNLFASRLAKWPDAFQGEDRLAAQRALYLEHARLAAGPRPVWRDAPLVPILYNQFIEDADLRCQVAQALDLNIGDRGLETVPTYGHGSSFQGYDVPGLSVRAAVMERWRAMVKDPTFQALALDADVEMAGQQLFDTFYDGMK